MLLIALTIVYLSLEASYFLTLFTFSFERVYLSSKKVITIKVRQAFVPFINTILRTKWKIKNFTNKSSHVKPKWQL